MIEIQVQPNQELKTELEDFHRIQPHMRLLAQGHPMIL